MGGDKVCQMEKLFSLLDKETMRFALLYCKVVGPPTAGGGGPASLSHLIFPLLRHPNESFPNPSEEFPELNISFDSFLISICFFSTLPSHRYSQCLNSSWFHLWCSQTRKWQIAPKDESCVVVIRYILVFWQNKNIWLLEENLGSLQNTLQGDCNIY